MLGKNLIEISDYKTVSKVIADIILSYQSDAVHQTPKVDGTPTKIEDNLL